MSHQVHSITGQITTINSPKSVPSPRGRVLIQQSFTLLQHTEDVSEVSMRFNLGDKYHTQINGFSTNDHVRVFFTIKTVSNPKGYATTYFNAHKIEAVDAPLDVKHNNTPSEHRPGFNPNNNSPA